MELKGKVALVTGAPRGIGAAIAEELARRGADLFITWSPSQRSIDSASEVVQSINDLKLGTTIHGIAVDLTLPLAATDVVTECMKYYSYIDILVNNAGVELVRPFNATSLDEYNRVMDVNLRAPFLLIQAASPHLRGPARIINVSSIVARRAFATGAVYAASKAGLEAMTRCMAKELGKDGTTVNSVAPGIVQTDMVERAFSKEDLDMNAQGTPVGQRNGKPDDVAQVVAWLSGDQARWVSGQCISASGGVQMI